MSQVCRHCTYPKNAMIHVMPVEGHHKFEPAPSADGRREDFKPWPKIWAVRGKFGSNTAFFNLQAAERFINERERPENFHIFEYVPAPAPVSGEELK